MTPLTYRPAEPGDCRAIAALYRMAAEGVADYIWQKLAEPGEDLLDVGTRRYARTGTAFSYENCVVAVTDGRVVGMVMAFPMHVDPAAEPETDPVLAPYAALEEDASFYIAGLAVEAGWRGRGIGGKLLSMAEECAQARGFGRTSLIVFETNRVARALYRRAGYVDVKRAAIVAHPLIEAAGNAVLVVKQLVGAAARTVA